MRAAAIEFRSERYLRVDGKVPDEYHDSIAGLYRCGDGRWVRLHTNLPHHCSGLLKLLGCEHDRGAVQRTLDGWKAEKLEDAAAAAGLVVTACRSFAEWDAHPQGHAVATLPLFSIEQIGDAPAKPLPAAERPLTGIKVLDLTRIIAGPVCGRTLAAHGADVLLVTAPHLPSMRPLVIDTGRGKLSASIDLRRAGGRETLAALVRDADVFVQGYRPGAVAAFGFGPEDVAKHPARDRLCVALRLRPRRSVGRSARLRFAGANGWRLQRTRKPKRSARAEPRELPAQELDHATGYLLAFAAMTALRRRAERGGSWHVRCSLAQTGFWLRSLGRIDGMSCPDPRSADVRELLEETSSGFGRLTAVRHAATMSETPPRWTRQSVPLGTHAPAWPH